jgi:DHA1 family bicyclomycin/chloramphenicol resistance-like MFS transporter
LNETHSRPHSSWLTVLLGVLIALPALATDLYLPALPDVARALDAPVSAAQFTLTSYFFGLAAGQLMWGPLSDRFGRKPVLFAGLGTMLVASIAAALVESVAALTLLRLAQGLGTASGTLIGRTIVRDMYTHERAARLLATMTIVFSFVPITAPFIGALLVAAGGWPWVLAATAAVAAILLICVAFLEETAPAARRSVHPVEILRTFGAILADRRFRAPFLLVLASVLGVLAWVSISSFTLVRGFGVSTLGFGLMFGLVMLGQILGAWTSSRLVVRFGIPAFLRAGAMVMCCAGISAALMAWTGVQHWSAVVLPFMAFLYGTALVTSNAMAAALTPFPHAAGSASSLIGATGFGLGALLSIVLGATFDQTARPMATAAAIAGVAALFFERSMARGKA